MQQTKYIWKNGELMNWEDATTHVMTHGLHYGTSVFEGIRYYNTNNGPQIFRLDEHLERLLYSASTLEMNVPYSKEELKKAILETCSRNKLQEGYIRPLIYCDYGNFSLTPKNSPISVTIVTWYKEPYLGDKDIKVKTSKYIRIHPNSLITDAKVGGHYINTSIAQLEVSNSGYDEALFLDYEGNVAEAGGANIFHVKNKKIYTVKSGNILPGITRDSIIEICKDLKLDVIEKTITLDEIYKADEAFFTGTATEVQPIFSIDDKIIGKGDNETTYKIKKIFLDAVSGKIPKYNKWLTAITN